jgi:hypothetical protein
MQHIIHSIPMWYIACGMWERRILPISYGKLLTSSCNFLLIYRIIGLVRFFCLQKKRNLTNLTEGVGYCVGLRYLAMPDKPTWSKQDGHLKLLARQGMSYLYEGIFIPSYLALLQCL